MSPKKTTTATETPVAELHWIWSWAPFNLLRTVWKGYWEVTSSQTMLIDTFIAFLLLVGGLQALYYFAGGHNPFNAFLAGFIVTVGQFVLTIALRMQTQEQNKTEFPEVTPERSFADFIFGSLILQLFCVNYIN